VEEAKRTEELRRKQEEQNRARKAEEVRRVKRR
jgi:hypothetical protein